VEPSGEVEAEAVEFEVLAAVPLLAEAELPPSCEITKPPI
jgi:hypothetical protein